MDNKNKWQLIAKQGHWIVEYKSDSRLVRVTIDGNVSYFDRDTYQLLWGVLTQGLDQLDRIDDESGRMIGIKQADLTSVYSAQTHH